MTWKEKHDTTREKHEHDIDTRITKSNKWHRLWKAVTPQIRVYDRPEANIHLCFRSLNLLVTY